MTGRPSTFTQEVADAVCSLIAEGGNLNAICQRDDMPSRETVYKWMREQPAFADNYARSREDRADWRSDRIDNYIKMMMAGEIDSNQCRVAIDAEKWQAGKEKPKRYGDKIAIGGDAEAGPLTIAWADKP